MRKGREVLLPAAKGSCRITIGEHAILTTK